MNKTFRNTILSVLSVFLLSFCINVNAANVAKLNGTEYDTLQAAINACEGEQTVILLQDLEETPIIDGKHVVLDLGGNTLTVSGYGLDIYSSNVTVKNGTIYTDQSYGAYLNHGNTFTLDSTAKIVGTGAGIYSDLYPSDATDTNTVVVKGEVDVPGSGVWAGAVTDITIASGAKVKGSDGIVLDPDAGASKLVVNGYVAGSNVAITINGTITSSTDCPTITLGSTAELVASGDETVGLYLAGYGKTTIANGAKITGEASAIEIRAGELTINGGTFTSTATGSVTVTPNGNGSTTVGAALAIAQHTTKQHIKVNIKGGTFNGVAGLYESNPQQNESVSNDIDLEVTGGTFNATGSDAVYSQDLVEFINGGTYVPEVDSKYVVPEKTEYRINDDTMVIGTPVMKLVTDEIDESSVPAAEVSLIEDAIPDGFSVGSYYDVDYEAYRPSPDNSLIGEVEEADHAVKVTLTLPQDLPTVPTGYTRVFKVLRIHNGQVTVLDATDNGNGTISCYSDKFSTYVVTYRDTKSTQYRETSTSSTTSSSSNPNTGDPILLFMILMVIGLVGGFVTIKKLANR